MRISDWSSDVCSSDLNGLFSRDRSLFLQCHGHGTLIMRQRRAIRAVQPPGRTPFVVPQRWLAPRQFHGGRVIISNHAISIGCIDSCRQRLQRSEEHTSELQSLMRISYAVFCLKKKKKTHIDKNYKQTKV